MKHNHPLLYGVIVLPKPSPVISPLVTHGKGSTMIPPAAWLLLSLAREIKFSILSTEVPWQNHIKVKWHQVGEHMGSTQSELDGGEGIKTATFFPNSARS